MSIAERIIRLRGKESRASFAKRIGIVENTLRNYEKSLSLPNSDVISSFYRVLNVSPQWLILGNGPIYADDNQNVLDMREEPALTRKEENECPRCAKLEEKLEKVENQRDELVEENRKLWKENGELKERCARLEPRQKQDEAHPFDERRNISGSSEVIQSRL